VAEDFFRQPEPGGQVQPAPPGPQLLQDAGVVPGVAEGGHPQIVLGGGPEHGGPPDVDMGPGVLDVGAGPRCGLPEGV